MLLPSRWFCIFLQGKFGDHTCPEYFQQVMAPWESPFLYSPNAWISLSYGAKSYLACNSLCSLCLYRTIHVICFIASYLNTICCCDFFCCFCAFFPPYLQPDFIVRYILLGTLTGTLLWCLGKYKTNNCFLGILLPYELLRTWWRTNIPDCLEVPGRPLQKF